MAGALPLDPFRDVPDPSLYVPRDASDLALARLAACVGEPKRPCALLAPPGCGKTLLLHSLARLLPERSSVYVPNPTLSPAELAAWTLDSLEAPSWGDATGVFAAYLEHLDQQCGALVWLFDDAHGMGDETAGWLRRMQATHASLRLVFAAIRELSPALGKLERVRNLARPMSLEETRRYLEYRLLRGGRSDASWIPAQEVLCAIQRSSGGIPRAVCARASALLAERCGWTRLRPVV